MILQMVKKWPTFDGQISDLDPRMPIAHKSLQQAST